jgi:hypothetical protein
MNVTFAIGLAIATLVIGVLVGLAWNGREQIARDKRQARAQLELNDRENRVRAMLYELHEQQRTGRPGRVPDREPAVE